MTLLLTGLALFVSIIFAHLLLWRLLRVKSAAKLLVALALAAMLITPLITSEWIETAYVTLLFGTLSAAYLLTMPAIESDSPSSLIVLHVQRRGLAGCTVEELRTVVTDELFVLERLEGLVAQGLVRAEGERYFISDAGRRFLRLFIQYHAWAGRAQLGG